ncbi:hypothetical protein SSX86_010545 [Deinandra increscens subsp. villosa]|uniref:FHA domain-containing protein n=1 Tax=Deinandra increscens subsp. villosa TaxID=3103831 RepID=A0AAP0DBZ9_9ASTR
MAEATGLKLIMEKGPREGETLKYSSGTTVKLGRVVRGNTIAIKDAGISSKHICIQFDNQLSKWTLIDLDSSNGTILNGQILKPYAPSGLDDGDCIKIGELTSIIVKIGVESEIRPRRNPRRQAKPAAVEPVVKKETTELELGFDGELGGNEVKEPVQKRNLRTRAKKGVDSKNEVEIMSSKVSSIPELNQISENLNVDDSKGGNEVKEVVQKRNLRGRAAKAADSKNEVENMSSRRALRSSKKERVSFVPELNHISENLNDVDAVVVADDSISIEPKKRTRGRKGLPVQVLEEPGFDQGKPADIAVPGKRTRGGRRGVQMDPLKNAQISGLEENLDNANNGSSQIDEGNKETVDKTFDKLLKDPLENVKDNPLGNNLDTKGKEVAEELEESRKDGGEGTVKEAGPDNGQWLDLEKMTLSDFFDYLEVQLPKEIYDKTEKIISDMQEKARKCHEFRLQMNELERV